LSKCPGFFNSRITTAILYPLGNLPCSNDKSAKVAILSANVALHDINDVGIKSSGEHLEGRDMITLEI